MISRDKNVLNEFAEQVVVIVTFNEAVVIVYDVGRRCYGSAVVHAASRYIAFSWLTVVAQTVRMDRPDFMLC